jgi:hypothetical protein
MVWTAAQCGAFLAEELADAAAALAAFIPRRTRPATDA